jgi:L-alanine-DL-glutamate epimerase-like enolase superfamily enzyme
MRFGAPISFARERASVSQITKVEVFVYRVPIVKPIKTSFGMMPDRPAIFARVEDDDGAFGWGELWANFPSVGPEYRARLLHAVVAPFLLGVNVEVDASRFFATAQTKLRIPGLQTGEPGAFAAALAAADIALHDLQARRANLPLWRFLGGKDGAAVAAYGSGINPGAEAIELVAAAREKGFQAFKVKLGFNDESDLKTAQAVAESMKLGEQLMVDINQGWDVEHACRMVRTLAAFPMLWIEEPLSADRPAEEWLRVKQAAFAPLAAGENMYSRGSFDKALADDALSVFQPDMCKWGGFSGVLPVAREVVRAGKTFCPHFLGAGVGLMSSLHMLATVRGPGLVEVDVNPNALREDLLGRVFQLADGRVTLPTAAGIGFTPDLAPFQAMQTLHLELRA